MVMTAGSRYRPGEVTDQQVPYEPRLPTDREAWTAANLVIEEHGSRAQEHALRRISALKDARDVKGVQAWRLILDRIEQLQASPTSGNMQ